MSEYATTSTYDSDREIKGDGSATGLDERNFIFGKFKNEILKETEKNNNILKQIEKLKVKINEKTNQLNNINANFGNKLIECNRYLAEIIRLTDENEKLKKENLSLMQENKNGNLIKDKVPEVSFSQRLRDILFQDKEENTDEKSPEINLSQRLRDVFIFQDKNRTNENKNNDTEENINNDTEEMESISLEEFQNLVSKNILPSFLKRYAQ